MTQINAIQGVGEVYRHAVRNNQSQEERIEGIEKLTEGDIQRVMKTENREKREEKAMEKRLNHTKQIQANDSKGEKRRE